LSYQVHTWGITGGRPTNDCGTKWLPWQHRLPSNWTTKSATYDRIYQKRGGL